MTAGGGRLRWRRRRLRPRTRHRAGLDEEEASQDQTTQSDHLRHSTETGSERQGTDDARDPNRRGRLLTAAGLLVPVLAVGALYLGPYVSGGQPIPSGGDTKKYVWRANLVAAEGLQALAEVPQPAFWSNPDRPGFPALAALVRSFSRIPALRLAALIPTLAAIAAALAAGAFAVEILREPRWSFPIYALALGSSIQIAGTASPTGYLDNLVVAAIAVAAATPIISAARARPGLIAAVLLLAGAAVIHWLFSLLFAAILLALAIVLIPVSVSMFRSGGPLLDTPAVRLGALLGASAIAGAGVLTLGLVPPPRGPRLTVAGLMERFQLHIPRSVLWLTAPAAAAGAGFLLAPRDRGRRWGLVLAMIWGGSGLVAVMAFLLGARFPAYRVLGFALGLPILGAAMLTGLGRLLGRFLPPAGGIVAAVLIVGAVALASVHAARVLTDVEPTVSPDQLAQVGTAGRYLEAVGGSQPAIFVTDRFSGRRAINTVRLGLPPSQLRRSLVYLGTPEELFAGTPGFRPGNVRFNRQSVTAWRDVRGAMDRDPIVLVLSSMNRRLDPGSPAFVVGPGVHALRGPEPTVPIDPIQPLPPPSAIGLVSGAGGVLVLLTAVGLGWAGSLLRMRWHTVLAVAPSFGMAVLALAGVLADRVGAPLSGGGGIALVATAATVGWVPALIRGRGRRRDPSTVG